MPAEGKTISNQVIQSSLTTMKSAKHKINTILKTEKKGETELEPTRANRG